MPENYRLIAEAPAYLLFLRVDTARSTWLRFVLELKRSPVKKRRFQIGWDGERFAESPEIQAARSAAPKCVEWMELQLRRLHPRVISPIELSSTEFKIPFLVHFTRIENLPSIIAHGIHARGRLREEIEIVSNDDLRLDGHTEATSVSIAFPNSRMFYKYRLATPNSGWVVLLLENFILWTRNCAFCAHNAADSRVNGRPIEELRTHDAFLTMFTDMPGAGSRIEQRLKPCDPTDVQAEVLVFNIIPSKLIRAIVFESATTMKSFEQTQPIGVQALCRTSKSFFSDRKYVRSLEV
jgi:ssDNA thymidine ADP-ribosyltransferase, DarT